MIRSNAHTHTPYCDGKTPIRDMIDKAKALRFTSLGFSGHAHQPFDPEYCMSEQAQAAYIKELRTIQLSETELRIWVGAERDALSDTDRTAFDYIIGSTHYLPEPFEGQWVSVDGDMALLKNTLEKRYHGDGLALARDYYALEAEYIASYQPDVIGHFDLVRLYQSRLNLFDAKSKGYLAIATQALEKAFAGCTLMEVNTGGMARSQYLTKPYPDDALAQAWREMRGSVIITSDCHKAEFLDYRFEQTARELYTLGYRSVKVLGRADSLFEEIAL